MPRHTHFRQRFYYRSRLQSSPPAESTVPVSQTKERDEKPSRWVLYTKLGLSASIPIMLAIFTVVTYVQQMEINERNRIKDQEIANATREKDWEIANLTRLQDQHLANLTRQKDMDLALAQREEDQRQADDLRYQIVYSEYIQDISNILYKQANTELNNPTFASNQMQMLYIRRKTLLTLRQIDRERKSQLFIFLHENGLLPDTLSFLIFVNLEKFLI